MKIRYMALLIACAMVTKNYGMQRGNRLGGQRLTAADFETAQVRKIPLARRCLEHFGVGFAGGAVSGTLAQTPESVTFSMLPIVAPTYMLYQRKRGYNDFDSKSGMPYMQNDARMAATLVSQVLGYGAGVATAAVCRYWLQQQAIQEGSATEQ